MDQYVHQIRRAVADCSERGLHAAAKWAGDFLLNIPIHERPLLSHLPSAASAGFRTSTPTRGSVSGCGSLSFADDSNMMTEDDIHVSEDLFAIEEDLFITARESFNFKEFEKTAFILRECRSPKPRFLCLYSKFLASEKEAQDNWTYRQGGRSHNEKPPNPALRTLLALLSDVNSNESTSTARKEMDPFLLFLKGLILGALKRRAEAIECLILSVTAYPWNWSAWLQLGALIEDPDEWTSLQKHLPSQPTLKMLSLKILVDFNAAPDTLDETINELSELFPHSLFVKSQRALLAYHHRDFEEAEAIFDSILEMDPYRVDNMDIFANILYVQQSRAKLSDLAQRFIRADKDRPEVCSLIGNYYSIRCEHEKAVKYFKRAIQLDPTHLAAWTLMGHEYIEMKNPHAAIEAYRRAIDVNRKDFRAWYGLGKTYELLDMIQYSLHYYQRAAALRPYDSRMWLALAGCYKAMSKWNEAIDCMKRAQTCADSSEVSHVVALANLYDKSGDATSAALNHRRAVEMCQQQNRHIGEWAKSAVYAAEHEINLAIAARGGTSTANGAKIVADAIKEGADLQRAKALLDPVAASNAAEGTVAIDLLRKLKSLGAF
ncbi:Anaphase-promoting complex subunit 23 [Tulasnella sp. 331]|nr:Anaphase-promoting complex subunit 23 [Tulasnella sp. 331]KAG8890264.1 Anaphase-promoting complex subunit 23 [Tulasnella sp. 332]